MVGLLVSDEGSGISVGEFFFAFFQGNCFVLTYKIVELVLNEVDCPSG
jgi:hypothetical protein